MSKREGELTRLREPGALDSFQYDITLTLGKLRAQVISEHISILVRDKPWWIPNVVWRKLLKEILVMCIRNTREVE